jgi:hypothetical protein
MIDKKFSKNEIYKQTRHFFWQIEYFVVSNTLTYKHAKQDDKKTKFHRSQLTCADFARRKTRGSAP